MKIEQIPIATLVPYLQNAKSHPQDQIDKLARAIQEFGFRIPVLIDDQNVLVAGHGRLLAAKQLGLKNIPAIRATGMTPEQCRAFRIADNKLGESEWLEDILRAEMLDMRDMELDMSLLGFDDLDFLLDPVDPQDAEPQIDQAEELNKKWHVVSGDLWEIGEHRLLCGDSTNAEDVARLMGGEKAGACLTDPPYGLGKRMQGGTWAGSNPQLDKMQEWDAEAKQVFVDLVLSLSIPSIIWGGHYFKLPPTRCLLIWEKPKFPTMADVEIAWTSLDRTSKSFSTSTRIPDGKKKHATQKPVDLFLWCLSFIIDNELLIIFDPFLGSGTTMVAAENLKRRCFGIEISENYCAVILERMHQAFPGLTIRKVEKNP